LGNKKYTDEFNMEEINSETGNIYKKSKGGWLQHQKDLHRKKTRLCKFSVRVLCFCRPRLIATEIEKVGVAL